MLTNHDVGPVLQPPARFFLGIWLANENTVDSNIHCPKITSMAGTKVKKGWVHLDSADSDGVIVSLEDHDTVFLPIDVVIRACGSAEKISRFTKQLTDVLANLGEWIERHRSDIKESYLTVRDAGLLFLVVRASKPFNEELEDSLTNLDIEIAQNQTFDLIKLSVLALPDSPKDAVESFLDGSSLKYAE